MLTGCVISAILQMYTERKRGGETMDLQKVSERLTKLRGDESQAKVAEVIGISASALSMYECGERMPRDEIKVKLAAYYKTTVEALFYA